MHACVMPSFFFIKEPCAFCVVCVVAVVLPCSCSKFHCSRLFATVWRSSFTLFWAVNMSRGASSVCYLSWPLAFHGLWSGGACPVLSAWYATLSGSPVGQAIWSLPVGGRWHRGAAALASPPSWRSSVRACAFARLAATRKMMKRFAGVLVLFIFSLLILSLCLVWLLLFAACVLTMRAELYLYI